MGQAIEKFKFTSFRLEFREGVYHVRGGAPAAMAKTFSWIQYIQGLLRGSRSMPVPSRFIEVSYSRAELETFHRQERAKRRDGENFPDPYSISQILRGVGTFLEGRCARALLAITLEERCVTVLYQNGDGEPMREMQDLDFFYDYWIKLYLHRSNRPKSAMPDEPTLYVQW